MKRFEQLFWFWYAAGLLLMLTYHVPKPLAFANGFFLVLYATYGFLLYPKKHPWLALLIALLAFGTEWLGVHTGFPFGHYHYDPSLGILLDGVPFTIALAWVGIAWNTALIAQTRTRAWRAIQIAALATALDLVLDPVAVQRRWWIWDEVTSPTWFGIPYTNYIGWFVVFFLFGLLLPKIRKDHKRQKKAVLLYTAMLVFFISLAIKG
jgi:putative membrane protein